MSDPNESVTLRLKREDVGVIAVLLANEAAMFRALKVTPKADARVDAAPLIAAQSCERILATIRVQSKAPAESPRRRVLTEAWVVVDSDSRLVVEAGTCGPQLFVGEYADLGAQFQAGPNEHAVRVHLVEAQRPGESA